MPDHSRRHSCHDRVFRNIYIYNRTCAHHGMSSDMNAWEDCCIGADICSVAYHDGLNAELRRDDWNFYRFTRVARAEHLCSWPPSHVVFEDQISGMEVAVRADPAMIANARGSVE